MNSKGILPDYLVKKEKKNFKSLYLKMLKMEMVTSFAEVFILYPVTKHAKGTIQMLNIVISRSLCYHVLAIANNIVHP